MRSVSWRSCSGSRRQSKHSVRKRSIHETTSWSKRPESKLSSSSRLPRSRIHSLNSRRRLGSSRSRSLSYKDITGRIRLNLCRRSASSRTIGPVRNPSKLCRSDKWIRPKLIAHSSKRSTPTKLWELSFKTQIYEQSLLLWANTFK